MRSYRALGPHGLDNKGLADVGLTRSDLGRDHRSFFTMRLGEKQRVLANGTLRGLVSTLGVALLLALALWTAESRPTDHVALVSCPLFHPGIMGSAPSGDTAAGNPWARCQIKTP